MVKVSTPDIEGKRFFEIKNIVVVRNGKLVKCINLLTQDGETRV